MRTGVAYEYSRAFVSSLDDRFFVVLLYGFRPAFGFLWQKPQDKVEPNGHNNDDDPEQLAKKDMVLDPDSIYSCGCRRNECSDSRLYSQHKCIKGTEALVRGGDVIER